MSKNSFKLLLNKLRRKRWFWRSNYLIKTAMTYSVKQAKIVDDRTAIESADLVLISWPADLSKPVIGLVQDLSPQPYWTKYERFLKINSFDFDYIDIHRSDWLEKAKNFDLIVWRPEDSTPAKLEEQKRKTYLMEKELEIICFPDFSTLMLYEDKLFQYESLKMHILPVVDTFISHSFNEIMKRIRNLDYPLVSKIVTGAGSMGVEMVRNISHANTIAKTIFCLSGRATFFPYLRQKDYVYFQKFQKNEGYDLRVIVIGNMVFGYYRDVPKRDFRASGIGLIRKEAIPQDAIQLAVLTSKKLGLVMAAVDMLKSLEDGRYYIIEVSPFIQIDTAEQLHVNGKAGVYIVDDSGNCVFKEGCFWIQELALREFLEKRLLVR